METALQWSVWTVAMVVILGALARAWRRQAAAYTGAELHHPKLILGVGLATGVPFVAMALAAALFAGKDRWVALVFLAFATMGGWLVLEYFTVRYVVKPEGFEYRTVAARGGFATWGQVKKVSWSQVSKWFVIELQSGSVVRV